MAEKVSKECCLCGDIGFSNDLRLCPNCGFRLQHTYCSSSYPNIDMETWLCEWCLHDQYKKQNSNKRSKAFDFLLEIAQSLPRDEPGSSGGEEKRSRRRKDDEKRSKTPTNPKKHKVLDRWRKPSCNSSSSPRGIGRRYKLLADVLC